MFDILGFESPIIASLFNTIANESRLRGEGREINESRPRAQSEMFHSLSLVLKRVEVL